MRAEMKFNDIKSSGVVHFVRCDLEYFKLVLGGRLSALAPEGGPFHGVGDWVVLREHDGERYTGNWRARLITHTEMRGPVRICHFSVSDSPAFGLRSEYFGEGTVPNIELYIEKLRKADAVDEVLRLMMRLGVAMEDLAAARGGTGGSR